MPTRTDLTDQIAMQMMKSGTTGHIKATKKQRENFKERHRKYIEWAIEQLPKCSSAVGAVVVKCAIKYGQEKVSRFCDALASHKFNGVRDPAYLLWRFLQKHRGKDTKAVYWRTVCAAKAYMEERTLIIVREVKEDIFDWDEGWTVPDELLDNWHPDILRPEDIPATNNPVTWDEIKS